MPRLESYLRGKIDLFYAADAAPRPLSWVLAQPGPDGIEGDVTNDFDQVPLVFDEPRLEPLLEEMPDERMAVIEIGRVFGLQTLHAA